MECHPAPLSSISSNLQPPACASLPGRHGCVSRDSHVTSISSIPFISSALKTGWRDEQEFDVQQDHWLSTVEEYESSFGHASERRPSIAKGESPWKDVDPWR